MTKADCFNQALRNYNAMNDPTIKSLSAISRMLENNLMNDPTIKNLSAIGRMLQNNRTLKISGSINTNNFAGIQRVMEQHSKTMKFISNLKFTDNAFSQCMRVMQSPALRETFLSVGLIAQRCTPALPALISQDVSNLISATRTLQGILNSINFNLDDITFTPEGAVRLNDEQITHISDIVENIETIITTSNIGKAVTIEELNDGLDRIRNEINHQSSKANVLAIVLFLLSFLFAIYGLTMDKTIYDNYIQCNIQVITTGISQPQIRRVSREDLKVYNEPRRTAKVNGILPNNQIVQVLFKNRNWCYIVSIIDDEAVYGWVYTRYVEKIQKINRKSRLRTL